MNFRTLPVNKQFMRIPVKPDTWLLNGISLDNAAPHPHVIIGDEYALIMDTTDLDLELRKYVEEYVTDKPLMVASTHSHGDHTKNNYMFEDCPIYMTAASWQEIQENRVKSPERTPGTYTPKIIGDGDIIDLGGRQLECIDFCGCHSPTSIVYLDTKYGCLFTGDEFEGGQVLLLAPTSSVELYKENLIALKKRIDGRATCICPPHNGSPIDIALLDYTIENCDRIMSGIEGMEDIRSMTFGLNPHGYDVERWNNGYTRRSEWMGSSLVYDTRQIFKK